MKISSIQYYSILFIRVLTGAAAGADGAGAGGAGAGGAGAGGAGAGCPAGVETYRSTYYF